ncbi:hypothetical protein THRCLA_06157 [Thraustotheca clavata]|uniref:C2H2-type domain-containing protein n=1 Tax=Thraustotheca clavata TaxID=74557 RepID=A0A1V9ZQF9_9STRA|nr:hypothetical protein THRCLA_06157 [Thraustotheca clavata]
MQLISALDEANMMPVAAKDKLYVCKECNQSFRFKGNLKRHQMTKHVGLKPYQCPLCPKMFARKADMEVHMRVHTGEKPYSCPQCDKQFARISDMRSHERTHSGIKKYACQFPGCTRRFARKVDLRKHEFVHESGTKIVKRTLQPKPVDECAHSHDHAAHARGCGHLSIEHGNHFDFVVNNQLICLDGNKMLDGLCEALPGSEQNHGPRCGHLAVRHKDHVDYVVDNTLECSYGGLSCECDTLKLLEEDFWDFYGAVDSMTTFKSPECEL